MCDYLSDKLFIAVFYSNLDSIKSSLASIDCNNCLLKEGFVYDGCRLPLYYLTLLQRILFLPPGFKTNMEVGKISDNAFRCIEVLKFWKNECGIDVDKIKHLPYYDISDDDMEEDEYLNCTPKTEFLKAGIREIDLELFKAAEMFDFKKIKNLLKLGANPDVNMDLSDFAETDINLIYSIKNHAFDENYYYWNECWGDVYGDYNEDGIMKPIDSTALWGMIKGAGYCELKAILDPSDIHYW